MTPLTPASIALILQYIVPPSQLSFLPPHLLSSSLLQRHHFLQISPDDPISYLAWPSDSHDNHLAIRLLEDFHRPIDDHLYASFPVRYTSDSEFAYSHVSILPGHPSGPRLVFQWNTPDGWKYHNVALMPFPSHSSQSPQDPLLFQSHAETTIMGDQLDTDTPYWDAYAHPYDSQSALPITLTDSNPQHGAEDPYWSLYAAIQGSGDSTLPTPPPLAQEQNDSKRIFVSYPGLPPTTVPNPLDPPSPNALARRLADLSPRLQSPPLADHSNSESASDSAVFSSLPHPPLPSSIVLPTDTDATFSKDNLVGESRVYQQDARHIVPHHESYEALKDSIRGIYRLWRSSSVTHEEKEEFLEIVRQIVAESSLH